MSIIYDALQKTQKNRELKSATIQPVLSRRKFKPKFSLIMLSAGIVAGGFFLFIKSPFHPIQTAESVNKKISLTNVLPTPRADAKLAEKNEFNLQGIFNSDKNKMALINNQMVQQGDFIGEVQVIQISDQTVTLRRGSEEFTVKGHL